MQDTMRISCPYCGEAYETTVDISVGDQRYWEDCAICCKPILLQIHVLADGEVEVTPLREDD